MDMYQWTAELSVNNHELDGQHQELFRAVNRLMEAMRTGQGTTKVMEMVAFLDRYASEHFGQEERYMTAHHYPDYAAHKAEHEDFLKDVSRIKAMEGRSSIAILLEVQQTTCDWMKEHIKSSDKALADYLRQQRHDGPS